MLKSVKGKIVTGVVTIGLLSGVGAAFAYTDAGVKLQAWYDAQFKLSSKTVDKEAQDYSISKLMDFDTTYLSLKDSTEKDINEGKDFQINMVNKNINTEKNRQINLLNDKKAKIQAGMDAEFNLLVDKTNKSFNQAFDKVYSLYETKLKKDTDTVGAAAMKEVESELTKSKDAAVKELKDAIAAAKAELQAQLDSKTTVAITDIKAAIDVKTKQISDLLTKKADEFLENQKRYIGDKAQELEKAAIDELNKVVDGI
ncbi:hypothetical protein ACQKP0_02675 [Heyndrickxia sp. NPDC080065]|uniref:hypothetical protein n=1 Tax=Heyndrickxia sp. NPDC080065 TaxID=3390568 RepID=UPI003D049961